jgi:hypothetical protein
LSQLPCGCHLWRTRSILAYSYLPLDPTGTKSVSSPAQSSRDRLLRRRSLEYLYVLIVNSLEGRDRRGCIQRDDGRISL